ncbi:MAG: phage major capsid protein [Chloroflexota bacterium]|nr:phage major capsid protein [Chloroflexota bacterium]
MHDLHDDIHDALTPLKHPSGASVHKAYPIAVTAIDAGSGIVEAIVNVFGILDDGCDIIASGAFTRSIVERGTRVHVLDNHQVDSVMRIVGKTLDLREVGRDELPSALLARHPDATGGLWTRTQYLLETPEGEGVFRRIAAGAVGEYSVGFDVTASRRETIMRGDRPVQARIITEARLWEYSPVIWGMNPATATVGVKAAPATSTPSRSSRFTGSAYSGEVTLNMTTATGHMLEAKRLLETARVLLSADDVSDDARAEASHLRERADRIQRDADLLTQIERQAKSLLAVERDSMRDDSAADGFRHFGEFVGAVVEAKSTGRRDPRLTWLARDAEDVNTEQVRGRKALSGTSGASGGFLLPATFVGGLQAAMIESSAILPRVTVIPMTARTAVLPVLDYTQALPAGEPRQFGGVQAFYQDEGAESDASEPKFREHTLTAHELTVYTEANNSLLADSGISLDAFLNSGMGMLGALNWKVEYKIFRGTGVGQPLGILNAPAAVSVTRATANTVSYIDLAKMDEAALPSTRLAWFASISLKTQLRTLKDDANQFIWAEAASGLPATLLGYPVIFTDKLPRLGTRGDLVLADMSYYLLGDRQSPTLDVSTEANFRRNRTAYRLIHRHDGSPWMNAPITLADTQTQVSPFVVLA